MSIVYLVYRNFHWHDDGLEFLKVFKNLLDADAYVSELKSVRGACIGTTYFIQTVEYVE